MTLKSIYAKRSNITATHHAFTGQDITGDFMRDMLYGDICSVLMVADKKNNVSVKLQTYVSGLFKIYDFDYLLALYFYYVWAGRSLLV